jgi:hypothetical protein
LDGKKGPARRTASAASPSKQRNFVVFSALIGALALTTALLLALAPAPLAPGAASSLFAMDTPDSLEAIFNTKVPPQTGRWDYIYIHHSATPGGDALTLGQSTPGGVGDHFIIGNGDGCADGEVQIAQRWNNQQSALPPAGASTIDPHCISICLVGDFDHTVPTPVQMRRLTQLVNTLQTRFHVPGDHVLMATQPASPAGIGRYFPITALRGQLLQ